MRVRHLADHAPRHIEFVDGEGAYLIGANGKRYLDFLAGWCVGNVGWKRKEVTHAMAEEAQRGLYAPPMFASAAQEEFAALLVRHAPGDRLARAIRCVSGSEAVEYAIMCSRAATGKPMIVSVDGVYHGHTYGAAALGDACEESLGPCPPGFLKIPLPHGRYGASPETVIIAFEKLAASRDDIAAFISEPVFTNAGVIVPPEGFYPAIQEICRRHGILFVMDEVATGFGRCGALFASERWGVSPDIMCLGKGLTGGYAAMGACLVSEAVWQKSGEVPLYSTFGWLQSGLSVATANVQVILHGQLWKNAEQVGHRLYTLCTQLERLPIVAEVRGIGLLLGIELKDKKTEQSDARLAAKAQDACADQGLVVETAGAALFISPPLILTEAQAERGYKILDAVLERLS